MAPQAAYGGGDNQCMVALQVIEYDPTTLAPLGMVVSRDELLGRKVRCNALCNAPCNALCNAVCDAWQVNAEAEALLDDWVKAKRMKDFQKANRQTAN